MRAVEVGHTVVGFDIDRARVKRLSEGDSYVEDIPSAQLGRALASGRYTASTDEEACAGFDYAVITVPTPVKEGVPDLSCTEEAAAVLARGLRAGATVVLESTTYPGTTAELLIPIFQAGSSPESLTAVKTFYEGLVETTVREPDPGGGVREAHREHLPPRQRRSGERARHVCLRPRHRHLGGHRGGGHQAVRVHALRTRVRVGGHCLPVDPSYLSCQVKRRVGEPFRFVELANDINDHMPITWFAA